MSVLLAGPGHPSDSSWILSAASLCIKSSLISLRNASLETLEKELQSMQARRQRLAEKKVELEESIRFVSESNSSFLVHAFAS